MLQKSSVFLIQKRTYKAYLLAVRIRDMRGCSGRIIPHGIFVIDHAKKSPSQRGFFIRTAIGFRYPRTASLRRFQSYDL